MYSVQVYIQSTTNSVAFSSLNFNVYQWRVIRCLAMPQSIEKNRRNRKNVVRDVVFKAVTMNNGVFWDVMSCGYCKNRRLGGI
jgi:hypothetical protein